MSKLYKDLRYDTDRVMQPGDPLTSFDGNTAIRAGNATGKGFIETYGDVIDHYYDVIVDIPQVSGASARIRLKDVDETSIGVEILSIDGFPGAEIDNNALSHIKLNGASWGYVTCNPAWNGETYPDYAIIPIGFGGRIYVSVSPTYAAPEYCHWSDLEQTRQLISSKEISTTDQLPSLPLSVANGGTGVDGSSQSANKVLASPSSGTGAVSFRTLVAADIPDLNTSKLTAGTLGVARGGTGKSTHTANSVIIAGTSAIGAFQNVASESGAFYATGANAKPQFGTLPVAQGGTGATTAPAALTALGAAASGHTHDSIETGGLKISTQSGIPAIRRTTVTGNPVVTFPSGFSATYNGKTYTAPSGGQTIQLFGPINGSFSDYWVPEAYKDASSFSESTQVWYIRVQSRQYAILSYGDGPAFGLEDGSINTTAPTVVQQNAGTHTGSFPTITRSTTETVNEIEVKGHTHTSSDMPSGTIIPFATCATTAITVKKVATVSNGYPFSLETGVRVAVKFTYANPTSNSAWKLNVDNSGEIQISPKVNWAAGEIVEFQYDGTYWVPMVPQNMVTTDTAQTITGQKRFKTSANNTTLYVGEASDSVEDVELVTNSTGGHVFIGTDVNWLDLNYSGFEKIVGENTYDIALPNKTGTISLAEDLNILPITTSTDLSITMTADKYMYKVTDSGATGTFPTLTAPTGLPASCYYKFEMEWVTASPTATYAQTASTTPAMKWISSPVMQTDGLSHTYHISGRYDTTTSTFWMSCWKIDDAQGTITPDAHTLKYLLTTPTQTTSTTTNANDTITVQLSDHAINTVQVPGAVTNVVMKFPGQAVGKARDFMVRLIVTGSTVPSITLTEPDGSAIDFDVDDDSWTEIEQGVNLLMFTETAQ